ncbi:MAG: CxxxxCH/CxxCH domain-containing protein, partial [bacterium]|nr:CxxxxCH/CxxCH domain-containing protein [bacterium]
VVERILAGDMEEAKAALTVAVKHDPNAEQFAYRCDACHEPHGLTMNANGNPNIAMLKGSVEVMNYSVPGSGSNATTLISMVFESRTGADSFDDGSTQGNNVCVQCHQNNPRPNGTTTTMASVDGDHTGLDDYSNNEQGNNCVACHQHDYDASVSTVDGFMPLSCDGCHGYPPTSDAHPKHVGSYGYNCNVCHQNAGVHNNISPVANTTAYNALADSTLSNRIDVVFDTTNPSGAYTPAKGSRAGVGQGICTGLYCHGDTFTISAGGSDTTPVWNSTASGACGACHSVSDPGSSSHTQHVSMASTFGIAPLGCGDCHTPGTPASGTHVVGTQPNFIGSILYTGTVSDGDNSAARGSCGVNDCHNDGTGSASATAYTWGSSYADCSLCHAASPVTVAHDEHLAHPTVDCMDCHDATSSTSMSGKATHIDGDVTMANGASAYNGTTTVGDGGAFGTCDTGACHDAITDIAWNAAPTGCADCHYNTLDVNSFNGRDETASVVASAEWSAYGHSAQGAGVACSDCHDLAGTSHDFSATLSAGNAFRLNGTFTSGTGCNTQAAGCHSIAVVNHSAAAITGAGGSLNYTWSLAPECLNCHDPHGDGSNSFMISREIWDEETGTFTTTGTPPAMPTEQLSLAYTDTTTGITSAQVSYADTTVYSSICQECHTQTGGGLGFVDGLYANYSGHAGYPGNPGDCDQCHKHDTGFTAGCAGCHAYPPTSGAHQAHGGTAGGKPEFNCETCHGPNPGSATWHNQSSVSTYDPDVHFDNITLSSDLNTTLRGAENAYYNTTWTRSGASVAPSVTKSAAYAFQCSNVYCHGLESVTWTWDADAAGNPASAQAYITCGGCHGLGGDVDGDGAIDSASFRSRGGTLYQATNTAANYAGPLSGYSRGGHGDTLINNGPWAEDTAPGLSLPLACTECHDSSTDHFPVDSADRYRVGTVITNDALQTTVTNLCINCHTDNTSFKFRASPKHPSDHFTLWGGGGTVDVFVGDTGMSVYSTHDPVNVSGLGYHIDQYVDHWFEWGNEATTDTADDFQPFLPLGDSLDSAWNANNDTGDRVTCVTCHNPHGSDLFVNGGTPGSAGTEAQIPANKMLRLRDIDGELCGACHN